MDNNIEVLGKPIGKDKIFSKDEIYIIANSNADLRDRALFIILYLSNSRVSEITKRLRKCDIKFLDVEGKKIMLFHHLYTGKNRMHPRRNLPVNVAKEKDLIRIMMEYVDLFQDEDVLFNISRERVWQIMKKLCGKNPHFLRHSRLTHLVTEYGLSETALTRFAGWKDSRMASTYTHLAWKDIARMI